MKKILILSAICGLFFACSNTTKQTEVAPVDTVKKDTVKVDTVKKVIIKTTPDIGK